MKIYKKIIAALSITTIAQIALAAPIFESPLDKEDRSAMPQNSSEDTAIDNKQLQIINNLKDRGYYIQNIKLIKHQGKSAFTIDARKHQHQYTITLDYSSLKVINEKRKN